MAIGRPRRNTRDGRKQLIDAALQLLAETRDPRTITVATIVAGAECSPPTLYHHFSSKDELLRTAAAHHLTALGNEINAAARNHRGVDGLVARAKAYLDFAIAQPSMYRALFMGPPDGPASADESEPGGALAELAAAVATCLPQQRQHDSLPIAFGLWGIMHGLAAIHLSNPAIPVALVQATLESSVRALATGHGLDQAP